MPRKLTSLPDMIKLSTLYRMRLLWRVPLAAKTFPDVPRSSASFNETATMALSPYSLLLCCKTLSASATSHFFVHLEITIQKSL